MGEIADMMLDGTLCEGCGEYLGDDGGYPVRCAGCQRDLDQALTMEPEKRKALVAGVPKVACPVCSRKFKVTGIGDHWKTKHGAQT